MTTKLTIDCTIKEDLFQQAISDLVDLHKFIVTHQANEYFFFHPEYTAQFKLCTIFNNECAFEFAIGSGKTARAYELKTLQTLLFCLGDNIDVVGIPLFLQVGNRLFEVAIKGLTPNW